MTEFQWFDSQQDFFERVGNALESMIDHSRRIAANAPVTGHCDICGTRTTFEVRRSARSGGAPNLRESMACRRCKQSNRNRLLYRGVLDSLGTDSDQVLLLEKYSGLYGRLKTRLPRLVGSEFLSDRHRPGRHYIYRPQRLLKCRSPLVRHESITSLSPADASLDLIAHNDVLEHIFDYEKALAECARVLRPGGTLVFNVPFSVYRDRNLLRGRPHNGTIDYLAPPQFHDDGIHKGGIFTFHSFGWELLETVRASGFSSAHIGMLHDPDRGLVANNRPSRSGFMPPILVRARKHASREAPAP